MWKQLSLTVGVCFGIGLGLAPSLPVARASKCNISSISLELDAIEGDGDPDPEEAFWPLEPSIYGSDPNGAVVDLSTKDSPIEMVRQ